MNLIYQNLTIRNAHPADAMQLCAWWNDGHIMAHAGFPNGLNQTAEAVAKNLATDSDETGRRHIIVYDSTPIGEMNYRNQGSGTAEIGIKICVATQRDKGIGTILLAMFIDALFVYYGYEKIILDTNANNLRAQHVYEHKLGFARVGFRENSWQDQLGAWQSAIDYEMTKAAWQARQDAPPAYLHLRPETPADHHAVEAMTRDAFWTICHSAEPRICDEHLLVHRLRSCPSYVPALNYVAELNGTLVGHIIYATSHIVADDGTQHEVLTFGPLTVAPAYQGQGIGQTLMRHTFEVARQLGYRAIVIFGHPDYYPRMGFRRAAEFGITTADGGNFDAFMVMPLYVGALDEVQGRFQLNPVYESLTTEDALAFDRRFPPRVMHVPVSVDVLLPRLAPAARATIEGLSEKSLVLLSTKSQRELAALEGIDALALDTIRTVMQEYGLRWGAAKETSLYTNGG